MLTIETERRIAKFLIILSEEESKVQRNKEKLLNNYDFNPYQCFKFLDKNSKEAIDCYDISNFMKENSEYITLQESFLIILYYDTKDQNFWSYDNFVNYLLNGFNSSYSNKEFDFSINKSQITDSVRSLLLNIFKSELDLIHTTIPLVNKIKQRYDYNIPDLFRSITSNNDIDKQNINQFLIRNGYDNISDNKLSAIINRLSLSKNELVSCCDLQRLFEVGYCDTSKRDLYESMLNCPKNIIDSGYNQNEKSNIAAEDNNTILNSDKKDYQINSSNYYINNSKENIYKYAKKIIDEEKINDYEVEENKELLKNISLTNQKNKVLNKMEKKNKLNNENALEIPEEKYFIEYLENILGNEVLIERKKIELSLRSDFNIEDCIQIFKTNGMNDQIISKEDFIYGSQTLDLKFNTEEIELIFFKYDLENNGYLTFSDFFDMIVPFSCKYREMVENRLSMPYKPKYKTNEIFLGSTINYLKEVLQCICISETNLEKDRHKLKKYLNYMNLDKIFSKIDVNKKGFIVAKDLLNYLKNWNITLLDSESDLVFIRIDRDRNGIITLNDIINETSLVLLK